MANLRSAIKRMKQNPKRRMRNRNFSVRARTMVKKAFTSIGEGTATDARAATLEAVRALDKAAEKGILHKNNAARRKSRLMKRLAQMEKQASQ